MPNDQTTLLTTPRRTRGDARAEAQRLTRSFTDLAQQVRDEGLNDRTSWFYLAVGGGLLMALSGAVAGMVLLGDSWFQLLMAGALGIIFTQFAFLGHEAAHRQVLRSGPANDRLGRVVATLFVGMSYSWWMTKHTRHHGNPNKIGSDPDVLPGFVAYRPEDVPATGFLGWLNRHQGWLFFPLLPLLGIDLHRMAFRTLLGRGKIQGRALELVLLVVRFTVYFGLVFWLMPVGMAFAFLGIQVAIFGGYLGITFAPNHIGRRLVPAGERLSFLDKQVLTARNVSGGWWMTVLMGGLNYQIEHHLFPSMPRPHLHKARTMVLEYCREHDVEYSETSLHAALGIVVRYMHEVGLAASRSFNCPTAGVMGRS